MRKSLRAYNGRQTRQLRCYMLKKCSKILIGHFTEYKEIKQNLPLTTLPQPLFWKIRTTVGTSRTSRRNLEFFAPCLLQPHDRYVKPHDSYVTRLDAPIVQTPNKALYITCHACHFVFALLALTFLLKCQSWSRHQK